MRTITVLRAVAVAALLAATAGLGIAIGAHLDEEPEQVLVTDAATAEAAATTTETSRPAPSTTTSTTTTTMPVTTTTTMPLLLTDPALLVQVVDATGQQLMGRYPSEEDRAAFVEAFHTMEREAHEAMVHGGGVVVPDVWAQADSFVRERYDADVQAQAFAEQAEVATCLMTTPVLDSHECHE